MGWLVHIRHETVVTYAGYARASYNEARMTPLTTPGQSALEARLEIEPLAAASMYWDYWGTQVTAFDLQRPHERLLLRSTSTVETEMSTVLPVAPDWAELHERCARGRLMEFLTPTPRTTVSTALAQEARERAAGADPHEAAQEIASWVRDRVKYVAGATDVQTSAQEVWEKGQGVCQDVAHLTVSLLRVVGLPARYVSGYLHPDPNARPGDTVAGESHAWVEYWAGDWVGQDPTNRTGAQECHVVVARGRDYADVPPLKGIYHGAPSTTHDVTVEVTRLA